MNASKLSSLRGPNPLAHNSALAVAPSRRSHRLCAAKRETLTVLVDVDAVVQGLAPLSTAWAFSAASATTDIAGSPSVYTSYMQQLMPVVHQPYEAALLLRLLHDEGIVGESVECATCQAGPGVAGRVHTTRRACLHVTHDDSYSWLGQSICSMFEVRSWQRAAMRTPSRTHLSQHTPAPSFS